MLIQIAPTIPNSFRLMGIVVHLNFRDADVQLVVQFFFVKKLALLQIDQQVRSCRRARCLPVALFSRTMSECDGSARLCSKISIPVFGKDFPISRTIRS